MQAKLKPMAVFVVGVCVGIEQITLYLSEDRGANISPKVIRIDLKNTHGPHHDTPVYCHNHSISLSILESRNITRDDFGQIPSILLNTTERYM